MMDSYYIVSRPILSSDTVSLILIYLNLFCIQEPAAKKPKPPAEKKAKEKKKSKPTPSIQIYHTPGTLLNSFPATVPPAKSDSDVMFCLQYYQGLRIDRSLVY